MAIIARFTRTLPAPSATISGGFVFLLSAGWFTQANTGVAGSPIDGGTNSLANGGGDMQIFSDALATTQLPLHVVSFVTGGSPVAQVWVRTSSYTSGDTITIGKDNTQTVQPIVTGTYGRNATWVDFEVNYHFNSSNDLIDSTGNHDLTEIGTVNSVVGKIGDAVDCSGSYSNRLEATGYKGVTGGSARTLTAWCNNASSDNRGLATWGSAATAKRWSIWFNGGKFRTEIDGSFRQSTSGSSGAFKRFSSILTGSSFPLNLRHRINGSTTTGDSVGGTQTVNTGSSSDMKVAAYSNLSSVSHGSNITDELSLRSFAISDDQDLSEYTNQSDPDNFGTSSEWILVGGGVNITVDSTTQTQSIEQVTLTQKSSITIGGLSQAQSIEQVTLQASGTLSLNNLEQIQSIEQVNLTQAHIVSVNSIDQEQTLGQVTLLVAGTLAIDNIEQVQTLEQTVLSVIASLTVNDIAQAQEVEQVIVTAFNGSAVSIASIDQTQNIDAVTLSQLNVVSVENLSQSQLLQAVNFNGVVVGYLQGVLTIISAYNGSIKLTNPLTGEIRIL